MLDLIKMFFEGAGVCNVSRLLSHFEDKGYMYIAGSKAQVQLT